MHYSFSDTPMYFCIKKRINTLPEDRSGSNNSSFAREKKGESPHFYERNVSSFMQICICHVKNAQCIECRIQYVQCSSYEHKKGMYCTYFRKCIHIIFFPFIKYTISLYVKHCCIACAHFTTQIITIAWGFLVG